MERVGFSPRYYFSSLVFARLLLYFSHSYYFFVAITRKKNIYMMKGKTGIQPFPASGSPSAGFSLSLKCERRQQVAAYFIPTSFHKKNKHLKRCSFFFGGVRRIRTFTALMRNASVGRSNHHLISHFYQTTP